MSVATLSPKDQRLLREFNDWTFRLEEGTIAPTERDDERAARIRRNLDDIIAFARDYFPEIASSEPGWFHRELALMLTDALAEAERTGDFVRLRVILEWARAHAKSVWATLIIPMWLLARGWLEFMLLVSSTEEAAIRLLDAIKSELEHNEKFISDFGEFHNPGDWASGEFTTRTGVKFVACGTGQTPRGIRKGGKRPNFVVFDDVDKDNIVRNARSASNIVKWMDGAVLNAMSMGRGIVLIANNRFHEACALTSYVGRPAWKHIRVNALNENNEPAWPERYSLEEIKAMMDEIGYVKAQSEYMNNPMEEGIIFQQQWIEYREALPWNQYTSIYAYADPGYSDRSKTDFKVHIVIGRRPESKGREEVHADILAVYCRQGNPTAWAAWIFDFLQTVPAEVRPRIRCYMEGMFNQGNSLELFKTEATKRKTQNPMAMDPRGKKKNKQYRIKMMSWRFEKRHVRFAEHLKTHPEMSIDLRTVVAQVLAFDPALTRQTDDGPDCIEGCLFHVEKPTGGGTCHAPTPAAGGTRGEWSGRDRAARRGRGRF